jgi:hypothetical protein
MINESVAVNGLNINIQTNTVDILDITFFTDEAWFNLSGYINTQNSRLWSSENSYAVHENPLHEQKLRV